MIFDFFNISIYLTANVRPSVRALTLSNMNISTNCNQILSEGSLGWGKGCIMFWARSDWNSGFHAN